MLANAIDALSHEFDDENNLSKKNSICKRLELILDVYLSSCEKKTLKIEESFS